MFLDLKYLEFRLFWVPLFLIQSYLLPAYAGELSSVWDPLFSFYFFKENMKIVNLDLVLDVGSTHIIKYIMSVALSGWSIAFCLSAHDNNDGQHQLAGSAQCSLSCPSKFHVIGHPNLCFWTYSYPQRKEPCEVALLSGKKPCRSISYTWLTYHPCLSDRTF